MTTTSWELIAASQLPEHEAIRLLVLATGRRRSEVVTGTEVTDIQRAAFDATVLRRANGEPLQYIEGNVPFGTVSIRVDERALIPRPETEEMLHLAIGLARNPTVIVDLCTGSGNLAVALGAAFAGAQVYATEISPEAACLARENAERNGVDVAILEGDLFEPLPEELRGRVDLLVSNPPYLSEAELSSVPADVQREPVSALVAGPTGTETTRRIADEVPTWLTSTGVAVCEISEFHPARSAGLFSSMDTELRLDMYGKNRFVVARPRNE